MSLYRELKRRNVVRVAIAYLALSWLLIEVASVLFPSFEIPDWAFRFLVIVVALGFIPTLVFSWAFEITPEGLKREKDVVREESITHQTAKRLDTITIVLIVAAAALLLANRFWQYPAQPDESAVANMGPTDPVLQTQEFPAKVEYPLNSIAVLAFVNISDDPANEYFSDGISEELLNLLATIPELRVTARTSSFSFKGKEATIAEIAHELKVAYILDGSVRKVENRVRVTAQLIETNSATHRWTKTYDRTLDDIFALQDEIAGDVVESLKVPLLGDAVPKVRESIPEAYELFLRCRYFSDIGSGELLRRGEKYCRESLEIDPDYAPTWSTLSTIYHNLAIAGHIEFKEGYEQAKEFTRHALELDPGLARAHASLGWHAMMFERDLPTAAGHFRRALAIAPNDSRIISNASVFAETLGRFERAIELADEALVLNPLSPTVYGNIAIVHCFFGQFEKAGERFAIAAELRPNNQFLLPWQAKCHLLQHQPGQAYDLAQQIELELHRLWVLPMALYDLGKHEASDSALNKLIEEYPHEAASFIAENYAWRGELDQAFEWLNRAIDEKQYMWGSLVFDPAFSKLQADPRWADIRARDGRSEEQLRMIDF